MRSLAINYTFDPKVLYADYQNQYEFGDAFMVAPFESEKDYGKIYFPEGIWYDLYTDSVQAGKQNKVIPLNISKLPVYVKGSSIIPMQSLVQSTAILPTDTLTIHIYNGKKTNSFIYYEDDGKSFEYQKGVYYKRKITFDPANRNMVFNDAEGNYTSHFKYIKLILHGFEQADNLTLGNSQVKLQAANYAFLSAAASTDPQGSASITESCSVKWAVIRNNSNKININY